MASTFNKTIGSTLISLQNVATSGQLIGSAIDVTTKIGCRIFCRFGRKSATAFTNSPAVRIEVSAKAFGTGGEWYEEVRFSPVVGSSLTAQPVNGTCAAGQAVVAMTATGNFAIGDIVYIANTTIGNSEWGRIKSVSANASITLEENLTNAQTGSTVYRGAEYFNSRDIDLRAIGQLRSVVDNANNAVAGGIELEAWISYADTFG